MAWNSLTNLRSVETTTQLVVALCRQMEDWRRILRHLERIERERALGPSLPVRTRIPASAEPTAACETCSVFHSLQAPPHLR